MRSTDIVAYTYQAELLCPDCVLVAVDTYHLPNEDAEGALDRAARLRGIDREDESSFDSDEFPKVVFADSIESYVTGRDPATGREMWSGEHCGNCGEDII